MAFQALITPTAICTWWQAQRAIVLPKAGGYWVGSWGNDVDAPDYICVHRIIEFDPGRLLVFGETEYFANAGALPFDAEMTTRFELKATANGCTLCVEQDGFPTTSVADEFYAACEDGWRDTLDGLRNYLSAGND